VIWPNTESCPVVPADPLLPDPPPPPPTFPGTEPPGETGYAGACTNPPAPPPPAITEPPPPPPPTTKTLTAVTPEGTEKVKPPVDVYDVITGAFIVILNCLSAPPPKFVAVIVNVDVVSEPTAFGVPLITPVLPFKLIPVGKDPIVTEYVTVTCDDATTVKEFPVLPESAMVPKLPAAVTHSGFATPPEPAKIKYCVIIYILSFNLIRHLLLQTYLTQHKQ
jgi:hypothetical protein